MIHYCWYSFLMSLFDWKFMVFDINWTVCRKKYSTHPPYSPLTLDISYTFDLLVTYSRSKWLYRVMAWYLVMKHRACAWCTTKTKWRKLLKINKSCWTRAGKTILGHFGVRCLCSRKLWLQEFVQQWQQQILQQWMAKRWMALQSISVRIE